MNMRKGFTLIELVVVMVILGILAAFAIPKFYDFSKQARIADLNGLQGAINSASVTAHGAALALNQNGATGVVPMEGTNVSLVNGYPSSATGGIDKAVNFSSAYTFAAGVFTLQTNCTITYGNATLTTPPTITSVTTGC